MLAAGYEMDASSAQLDVIRQACMKAQHAVVVVVDG